MKNKIAYSLNLTVTLLDGVGSREVRVGEKEAM